MSDKKYPRKKLFVDKQVQGVLVRQIIRHWFLACLVLFIYMLALQVFTSGTRMPLTEHVGMLWEKYGLLVIALATVFPVFVYDSIKLSNRFAGPMYSFRNSLNKLANGESIRELTFRNKDYWKEITADLNKLAGQLNLLDKESTGSAS